MATPSPRAAPTWPPVQPAPSPPSAPGINQPVMFTNDQVIASGTVTNGTTQIELPNWYLLDNISASGVSSTAYSQLQITVSTPVAATVHFGFSLGGAPAEEYGHLELAANTPTQAVVHVASPTPQTFSYFIAVSDASDPTVTWTNGTVTIYSSPTAVGFPEFIPIVPPPFFGVGGGPPPAFPPPTPPPIGHIPPGVLVGPAIAAAAVPPSTAGNPLIRFTFGSATTPPASAAFPEFTPTPYTGFPNQPPTGVPIVFSNISTNPSFSGGAWTVVPPPHTTTTATITQRATMGPPIGPALPNPIPPRQFMAEYGEDIEPIAEAHAEEAEPEPEPEPETEPEPDEPKPTRRGRRHHR